MPHAAMSGWSGLANASERRHALESSPPMRGTRPLFTSRIDRLTARMDLRVKSLASREMLADRVHEITIGHPYKAGPDVIADPAP